MLCRPNFSRSFSAFCTAVRPLTNHAAQGWLVRKVLAVFLTSPASFRTSSSFMWNETRVSSMRDTVNLGKSVATMRNRVAAGRVEYQARGACRPGALAESGATKPVAPWTATNAQPSAPIPLMIPDFDVFRLPVSLTRKSTEHDRQTTSSIG